MYCDQLVITVIFFSFDLSIYLKPRFTVGGKTEKGGRERERNRQIRLQDPGLDQTEGRVLEIHSGLPHG